jgi:hypothetical protein
MMKKYISIILITLAAAGSGCKKDYLDLTNNPNVPSKTTPDLALSGALKTTADIVNGANLGNGNDYIQYAAWVGFLSQSTSFQPFTNIEQYQFTTTDFQGDWIDNYLNISNYNALLASTTEPNYQAIAKIMMAFDFEALVDEYNNVPYSQALQGAKILNPKYDTGQSIYTSLMAQLDAAIKLIQGAPATALVPSTSDIMYGGNMSNWLKFANTLKLRLCIRVTNVSALETTFAADVKSTETIGYLDGTNGALVNPGYLNSDADGGQESPLWRNFGFTQTGGQQTDRQEFQANTFAAKFFASNNDPRLTEVYSISVTPDVYTATSLTPNSAVSVTATDDTDAVVSTTFGSAQTPLATVDGKPGTQIAPSVVGTGLLVSAAQSAVIMSSAEALFLQAEAVARGIIAGNAATLYNAAITASFEFDDGGASATYANQATDDANAQTYYSQPGILYPATGTLDQQVTAIITQKWAALDVFGAFEAFNEERRTGIPNVPTSIYQGANAPNQVTRIYYPFIEYSTNSGSVAAEGTINKFTSKIFWAK